MAAWGTTFTAFMADSPIGSYIFLKLAILQFGGDVIAGLTAARLLMLAVFCAAALTAHLAVARIAGSGLIALAATLFAFSGIYALYHADAVFGESVMDLFGVMLAFHCMVVFVQEGRFRQLLVKTCAALFLGWHVYGLLLPFIALGFGGEAFALVRSAIASGGGIRAALALAFVRRRRRLPLAAMALFGFCWAVVASGNNMGSALYYEGIFFIGVPLTIITVVLIGARAALGKRGGAVLAVGLGAASAAVFALSVFYESRPYQDEGRMAAEFDLATLSELREIRDKTMGKSILVSADLQTCVLTTFGIEYALAGGFHVYEWETPPPISP